MVLANGPVGLGRYANFSAFCIARRDSSRFSQLGSSSEPGMYSSARAWTRSVYFVLGESSLVVGSRINSVDGNGASCSWGSIDASRRSAFCLRCESFTGKFAGNDEGRPRQTQSRSSVAVRAAVSTRKMIHNVLIVDMGNNS